MRDCWNPKKHDGPHLFDLDGYQDGTCLGRTESLRFIDKVKMVWVCTLYPHAVHNPCEAYEPDSITHDTHVEQFGCGWIYRFDLNEEDFKRLARAFDMSWHDIDEMIR